MNLAAYNCAKQLSCFNQQLAKLLSASVNSHSSCGTEIIKPIFKDLCCNQHSYQATKDIIPKLEFSVTNFVFTFILARPERFELPISSFVAKCINPILLWSYCFFTLFSLNYHKSFVQLEWDTGFEPVKKPLCRRMPWPFEPTPQQIRSDWDSNPETLSGHGLASRSNTIIASLHK